MEKIETRIENMERMERELWRRMDDIERREEDIEVRLGVRSRVSRIYKPKFIEKHEVRFREGVRNIKRLGSAKIRERRGRMQRQIREVVKKSKEEEKEPGAEEGKGSEEEKRIVEERKNILKKQISNVIERYKQGKKEEKGQEIPREIKQLKILTGGEASDARILFEFLLKKGSTNVEEAAKELNIHKETIESWAKDLESSGLIEVNEFTGKTLMKLRDISVAVGRKGKRGDIPPGQVPT